METQVEQKPQFFSKSDWQPILECFCFSRLLLLLTAWFSTYYQGNVIYQRYLDQGFFLSPKWWIDIWCRWDSRWQLSIVQNGYVPTDDLSQVASNLAFFPLYPYLVKGLTFFLPQRFQTESVYLLVGLIISNLCLLAAMKGIIELGRILFPDSDVRKPIVLLFCLPCSFYLGAFYSEGLFLALLVYSLLFAEQERWPAAAVCAALAALTRPHGVLLLIPLAWIYMSKRQWNFRRIGWKWLWFLLVPAAVAGFFYYFYLLTGNFFAFFEAQSSWGRSLSDVSAFKLYFEPLFTRHNRPTTIDLCMIIYSLVISILMIVRMKNKAYGIYALVCTLILIMTGNLYSLMRYTMLIFPIWMFTAQILRKEKIFYMFCGVMACLQVLLFCGWINYYWIA